MTHHHLEYWYECKQATLNAVVVSKCTDRALGLAVVEAEGSFKCDDGQQAAARLPLTL